MNHADIKYAPPGSTLNDDQVIGLSLRCSPKGKKSWSLFYRLGKQQRRPTIGSYPTLGLSEARALAREMLMDVARGIDPSAEKQARRAAPTMDELWAAYAKANARKKTIGQDEWAWGKFVAPALGSTLAREVTLEQVQNLHVALADTPYQANRVLALLSSVLNYGEAMGWRPRGTNPCAHVKRFREFKRRRYMAPQEASAIGALLAKYEPTHPEAVAFIRLLILTGARKSELANAGWSQLVGNKLVLDDHKTDGGGAQRVIHLSAAARQIIESLPYRPGKAILGIADPKKLWEKIRTEAGCPDLRLHDLRHSFASAGLSAGLTLPQIGELLGHSAPATTARYAHLVDRAAQRAVSEIESVVVGMMATSGPA